MIAEALAAVGMVGVFVVCGREVHRGLQLRHDPIHRQAEYRAALRRACATEGRR